MAATRYIVLIDSGSSKSTLSIFRSPHIGGVGQRLPRLGINKIFGDVKSNHEIGACGGGIHCARAESVEQDVKEHLDPILDAAAEYLKSLQGAYASTPANTDIYLLATAGMRNLRQIDLARYDAVLLNAREFIRSYSVHFRFNAANIRTIPGQQEGWFAWTHLHYGRRQNQYNPMAVLEMGGASLQYAYRVEDDENVDARFICTNRPGTPLRMEYVQARSWDDLGAVTFNNLMANQLDPVGGNDPRNNYCLPTGQLVRAQNGMQSIGTGNFAQCRQFANVNCDGRGITPLPDINSPGTDHFIAISSFWRTYDFFSQRLGAEYNPEGSYNRVRFNAVVGEYCTANWANEGWASGTSPEFTQRHCLIAALLLRILGDPPIGGNPPIGDNRIFIRKELHWTWGAATLIANHGGLRLCPADAEELPPFLAPVGDGNLNLSLAHIPPTFTPHPFVQPALIVPTPSVPAPSVPLWAYLSFAAALMLIGRLLVQRYRAKALGKISLPDMESASGVKGDMKDLGGTVHGLEGFYKD